MKAWRMAKPFNASKERLKSDLTIVIPFRNEAFRLKRLLNQLKNQASEFPGVRIIMVNDQTTDGTIEEITPIIQDFAQMELISSQGSGKKMASYTGVLQSSTKYVITLDADVILPNNWLASSAELSIISDEDLLILPVFVKGDNSFFGQLQQTDFESLVAVTGGSALSHNALMCNGANLFFKRSFYLENLDKMAMNISSGDDMFLLQAVKENGRVKYCFSNDVYVEIASEEKWSNFYRQRVRWAGKTAFLRDQFILFFGFLLLLVQLGWWYFLFQSISLFILYFSLKTLVDYLIIFSMNRKFSRPTNLKYILTLAAVYPAYSLVVPLISIFYRPSWKSRKIQL